MKTALSPHRLLPSLTVLASCLFVSNAVAQNAAPKQEVSVPTIEWVIAESNRSGLGNMRIRRLLAFVDSLDVSELEPTIRRLTNESTFGQSANARQMLYARWWKSDRDAVLRYLLILEGDDQHSALGMVLSIWAAQEPMKAWQWFRENSDGVRPIAAHSILREIAHDDPLLALKLFSESAEIKISLNQGNPGFIYSAWASRDPAAAAAHLDASSMASFEKASAMLSIVSTWIRNDVDAAWRWAKSIRSVEERQRAMETVITFLAIRDLERADQLLEDFPEGKARQAAAFSLVGSLYMEEPKKAFEIVQKHGGTRMESMIFGQWAIRDADKALEVAKTELPVGPRQQRAFNAIISKLARHDVDRAIKILEGFGPASNLTTGANIVATALAEQDLEKARTWAESLPEGSIKKTALSEMTSEWSENAPEDAASYALSKAAEDSSKDLLRSTLSGWGYQDPQACAQWIVDHLEEGEQGRHLYSPLGNWAEHDPDAASKWVAELPAGDVRDACIERLGSQWGSNHPVEGQKWLRGLEAGKARDKAIGNYASRALEYLPEEALEWCTRIDDEKERESAVRRAASAYLGSHPQKARQWIRSSSISDELKKSLLGE